MVRPAVRVLVRVEPHCGCMQGDPTPGETPTVLAVVVGATDARLELLVEDDLTLTADAATVLARIVREHLDRTQPTHAPAVAGHTGAPN